MTISAKFAIVRDRYVQHYLSELTRLAADSGDVASELLISINNDQIPYPYRYIRVDAMTRSRDGVPIPHEVRCGLEPGFEPAGYNFGTFVIEVHGFTWDSIRIAFDKAPASVRQIEGWFTRWLDVSDEKTSDGDGCLGVVHSVTPIENTGSWWYLTADFGTAPADALVEFMELLAGQGMTRIVVTRGRDDA